MKCAQLGAADRRTLLAALGAGAALQAPRGIAACCGCWLLRISEIETRDGRPETNKNNKNQSLNKKKWPSKNQSLDCCAPYHTPERVRSS